MSSLHGKTALVTGASKNIGRAIAIKLAGAGCTLTVAANRDRQALQETATAVGACGVDAHTLLSDLSTSKGCEELVRRARDAMGKIDILIHTIAIRPHQPFDSLSLADWEEVRGLILDSAVSLALGAVPAMVANGYGRVVFFTGLGAHAGAAQRAHVSAAKFGIVGLARGLAREYAGRNVRVNVISPGSIDTVRGNPEWYAGAPISADAIPMERLGTVEEIADATHFLVSDQSGFVTGQTLHVNGGEAFFE